MTYVYSRPPRPASFVGRAFFTPFRDLFHITVLTCLTNSHGIALLGITQHSNTPTPTHPARHDDQGRKSEPEVPLLWQGCSAARNGCGMGRLHDQRSVYVNGRRDDVASASRLDAS